MVWQDWEGPKLHDVVSKCIERVFFHVFPMCFPCFSLSESTWECRGFGYSRSSRPGRKRMVILSCISWVVGKSAHGRSSGTMTSRWQNYPHWVICNFFGTPPPPKKNLWISEPPEWWHWKYGGHRMASVLVSRFDFPGNGPTIQHRGPR